jgi:hypothetical protein
MQLLEYIKYKWKKKFGRMNNQNDALIQRYKSQYLGKSYQWTRPINNETVGDVVRIVDVKMRGDMVIAVFNAGTPINIDLINNYMQPYAGLDPAMPPSISTMPGQQNPIPIPEELQQYQTSNQPASAPAGKISFSSPQQPPQQMPDAAPVKKKSELFAMFQSEEKSINIPLKIKMPDIALVKMMYNNAADKDKFLEELAEYVIDGITVETAKDAMTAILADNNAAREIMTDVTPITTSCPTGSTTMMMIDDAGNMRIANVIDSEEEKKQDEND